MTRDQKIQALKTEFRPLWEMALNLGEGDYDVAFTLIQDAVKAHDEEIAEKYQDFITAGYDANWENIADNH
jgi:hypothetical protein